MPKRNTENHSKEDTSDATTPKMTRKNEKVTIESINDVTPLSATDNESSYTSDKKPISQDKNRDAICVAGSSKSVLKDRYSFTFWKKCETQSESVGVPIIEQLEGLKINELTNGTFEKQSLMIRISYKSEVKETIKGKCVSFLGIDDTGEISIVSFGKLALHLSENIEINCIYCIQNFLVYEENSKYPSGSGNNLQIKANNNFIFYKIDNDNSLPKIPFNFQTIAKIKSLRLNTSVDLIGVFVKDYGIELNNNSNNMRDLAITDECKDDIIATLWGVAAENFKAKENSVIVIRKALVSTFNEIKKINCTAGTLVWINSTIPEADALNKWFAERTNNNEHI